MLFSRRSRRRALALVVGLAAVTTAFFLVQERTGSPSSSANDACAEFQTYQVAHPASPLPTLPTSGRLDRHRIPLAEADTRTRLAMECYLQSASFVENG
jgi:hypothetical protein